MRATLVTLLLCLVAAVPASASMPIPGPLDGPLPRFTGAPATPGPEGLGFNSDAGPVVLGPDATAYAGSFGGVALVRDAVPPP